METLPSFADFAVSLTPCLFAVGIDRWMHGSAAPVDLTDTWTLYSSSCVPMDPVMNDDRQAGVYTISLQ